MSADAQLRAFIDRVLRLKEEQDALAADIREIYAEAKSMGFDKTAMGGVVAHLRRVEKKGASEVEEAASIFDLYLSAYHRATGTDVAIAHTHENTPSSVAPTPAMDGQAGVVQSPLSAPAANSPDPHSLAAADGQPSIPSDPAAGAKSDGLAGLSSVGAGAAPEHSCREGSQAVPDFVPAFLVPAEARQRVKLRPNCLRPDTCAGQGARHCHSCEKAAAQSEAA